MVQVGRKEKRSMLLSSELFQRKSSPLKCPLQGESGAENSVPLPSLCLKKWAVTVVQGLEELEGGRGRGVHRKQSAMGLQEGLPYVSWGAALKMIKSFWIRSSRAKMAATFPQLEVGGWQLKSVSALIPTPIGTFWPRQLTGSSSWVQTTQ